MAILKPRSGKGGRVIVGATILFCKVWRTNLHGDKLDTTNFESNGVATSTIGIQEVDVGFSADWNANLNFYDVPPGIIPTDSLANLKYFENLADNIFWLFPVTTLVSARQECPVRGLVSYDAEGFSNGAYTLPTGSV